MKNTTLWKWIAIAVSVCSFVGVSSCCFTGFVGAFAPTNDQRPVVVNAPRPELHEAVALPAVPDLCADFDSSALPPFEREARVTLEVIVGDDHRPTLRIQHNLPMGTVLAVDVSAGNAPGGTPLSTDGRYNDNAEIEITAPCMVAGPFRPVPPGRYTVTALTPAFAQPPQIESLFGQNHRNLRGPQVHTVLGVRIAKSVVRLRIHGHAEG